MTLPPDPIQNEPTLAGAQAAFEALDPVRILFENGSGGSEPGQPYPGFEQSFDSLPIPGTQARSWFVTDDGTLDDERPEGRKRERRSRPTRARPSRPISPATPAPAGSGRRSPTTTGTRTRTAPRPRS